MLVIPLVMIGTVYLSMGYKFHRLLNGLITGFFILELMVQQGMNLVLALLIGLVSAISLLRFYKNAILQTLLLIFLTSLVLTSIIYPPILGWWVGEKNWTNAAFSVMLLYVICTAVTFKYLILEIHRQDSRRELNVNYQAMFTLNRH